jgi:5-methylcytosine-specific restriction endonuclease McrA
MFRITPKTYAEALRDPRWDAKRRRILQRDGYRCRCCGKGDRTREVNHITYKGMPWDANDDDLETLCHACHTWRTNTLNNFKKMKTADLRAYITGRRWEHAQKLEDQISDIFNTAEASA